MRIIPQSGANGRLPPPIRPRKKTADFVQRIELLRLSHSGDELVRVVAVTGHLLVGRLDRIVRILEGPQ